MKISLNWVKDYLNLAPKTADEITECITLKVCEVEQTIKTGLHLKHFLAAEVSKIEPHPNADRLRLITIDTGQVQTTVVCGAHNFKLHDKVVYAPLGTALPDGQVLKEVKIRGVLSAGMLCSEAELGFSEDQAGLMLLPPDTALGMGLDVLFPDQLDIILDIDNKSLTHRPDLWGHYGFAREFSAIFSSELKPYNQDLSSLNASNPAKSPISVEVKTPQWVPRFTGLALSGVQNQPSPAWLRHRLQRVGLRAVNNLVDVTNYVMLDYGQPMHAFDLQQITGQTLTIDTPKQPEKLTTLYGKQIPLSTEDLVIYDAAGPTSLAGIIGTLRSGVHADTKEIYLEAANWDAVKIRKTSTKVGLRTDASQRYEKSLDPELTAYAILRAVELLKLSCPKLTVNGALLDQYFHPPQRLSIQLFTAKVNQVLGADLKTEYIQQNLSNLGFESQKIAGGLQVMVPSFRATKDCSTAEDLIEEIGRTYGYQNIVPQAPYFPIQKPEFNLQRRFERKAKALLAARGYHEVYLYPLTNPNLEAQFGLQHPPMKLLNPMSKVHSQMRTSLVPHMVQALAENQKHKAHFKLAEFGRAYHQKVDKTPQETNYLLLGVSTNSNSTAAWNSLWQDLKTLFGHLKLPPLSAVPLKAERCTVYMHPFCSVELCIQKQVLGTAFAVHPECVEKFNADPNLWMVELNLDLLLSMQQEYEVQPLYKFPPVHFDLSLVVSMHTLFQTLKDTILQLDERIIQVKFKEVFLKKELKDKKSMTIALIFRSHHKTLEPIEVSALQNTVVQHLATQGFQLRQ